jgi:hypothetical protein
MYFMQVSPWARALITRSIALVPTLAFAIVYAGSSKMDKINQGLNVLQSFQLPFALVPVLYMNTRHELMDDFVLQSYFKWVVQGISGMLMVLNMFTVIVAAWEGLSHSVVTGIPIGLSLGMYSLFIVYLLVGPCKLYSLLDRVDSILAWRSLGWLAKGAGIAPLPREVESACPSDAMPLVQPSSAANKSVNGIANGDDDGQFGIGDKGFLDES